MLSLRITSSALEGSSAISGFRRINASLSMGATITSESERGKSCGGMYFQPLDFRTEIIISSVVLASLNILFDSKYRNYIAYYPINKNKFALLSPSS